MPKLNTYTAVSDLTGASSFLAIIPTTGDEFNTVLISKTVLLNHIIGLITTEVGNIAPNSIELQASATHLQYREVGSATWIDLVTLASLTGPQGTAGATGATGPAGPQGAGLTILGTLANSGALPGTGTAGDGYLIDGYLWTWSGSAWTNVGLIQGPQGIQGIQGPQGIQGTQGTAGTNGVNGTNGENVHLQKGATHIQWKLASSVTWMDLVALSEITGPAGASGGGSTTTPVRAVIQGGYTPDLSVSDTFYISLIGHLVIFVPTNLVDGKRFTMYIKQNSNGGMQVINWPAEYKWVGGTDYTNSTTSNQVDKLDCQYMATENAIYCTYTKNLA